MTVVEPTSEELFTGLGRHAETLLPPQWQERKEHLARAALDGLVLAVELAWVAALGYAAYRFVA